MVTPLSQSHPQPLWGSPQNLLLLGIERLTQEDYREAIPLLQAALHLKPDWPLAHAWLANAFHLQRRLDEAAIHYRRLLELEPATTVDESRRKAVLQFAPRVFQVPSDPFGLLDAVAIHHPEEPLIAYHFFWEDDIDFPADNDPCDHELVWVRYDPRVSQITDFYTYFHGRILSSPASVREASPHKDRPRVNVQWGKHGSLPYGWEELEIQANARDIERQYLDLKRPQTLKDYNFATYQKLSKEGRQDSNHPRTRNWPVRFEGTWEDFTRFEKAVEVRHHFSERGKMRVSRWSNAALQQIFLAYNFRPKTEWPDKPGAPATIESQVERRVGAGFDLLMRSSERIALRKAAGTSPDPFVASLGESRTALSFDLPPMAIFQPETPRYPNVWFLGPVKQFPTYAAFIKLLENRFRQEGYMSLEVGLNEGADLALSVEHLQTWDAVEGLRHAHDIHIRFFWNRLERESLHRVERHSLPVKGLFWRVAASVHYEVEHAHSLHADVEVCPYCGRTGDYASKSGNLVERVHDPLGVEALLWGRIRSEPLIFSGRKKLEGLREILNLRDADIFLIPPSRQDINTAVIAAVIVRSSN